MVTNMSGLRIDLFHHFLADDATKAALTRIEELTVSNQQKLDALAAALDTAATTLSNGLAGVASDIQALKDKVAAGEALDFAAVESKVASLQKTADDLAALDAQNPPPAPTQ